MHTDLNKRCFFLFWEPCQAVWEWDDVAWQTWEFLCDLTAKNFILWYQGITMKLCVDSELSLFLGCWMSSCGNWCFTLHAWDGIPKSSCHGPGWKHSCLRAAWGAEQLHGMEGCVRGVSLCPRGHLWHLALCTVCVWAWEAALLAGAGAAGKSCTLASVTSLLLLSQPCFAAGWSSPSACAKQQSQSQILDRLGVGRHSEVSTHRGCTRDCVWLLCPTRAAGANCSFCASDFTLERKWEVSIIAVPHPCSPRLGCDLAFIVTAKPATSWPNSSGGKAQREGCWILLHPASLSCCSGGSLLLVLCLNWNMCRFWSRKMNSEEH